MTGTATLVIAEIELPVWPLRGLVDPASYVRIFSPGYSVSGHDIRRRKQKLTRCSNSTDPGLVATISAVSAADQKYRQTGRERRSHCA